MAPKGQKASAGPRYPRNGSALGSLRISPYALSSRPSIVAKYCIQTCEIIRNECKKEYSKDEIQEVMDAYWPILRENCKVRYDQEKGPGKRRAANGHNKQWISTEEEKGLQKFLDDFEDKEAVVEYVHSLYKKQDGSKQKNYWFAVS